MTENENKLIQKLISLNSETGNRLLTSLNWLPYLDEIGWLKSVEHKLPVDRNGGYLPWYTYPAIKFIEDRVQPGLTIFEYGSGNSTLWWADKVAYVTSCEHDFDWYNLVKEKIPSNVEYLQCNLEYGGKYSKVITQYQAMFDVIIIDGRDRVNCAKNTLNALRNDGVIIWDNSDRDIYNEGYTYLEENGFKRIDFWGIGPINCYGWCTSVFYQHDNCFGI